MDITHPDPADTTPPPPVDPAPVTVEIREADGPSSSVKLRTRPTRLIDDNMVTPSALGEVIE